MARDFATYWSGLVDKNPGMADPSAKLTISVASLKAQIERAYNRGDEDRAAATAAAKQLADEVMPKNPFGRLFG